MSFDSLGLDVPPNDVEALKELVRSIKTQKSGPLLAVEVGTWTGRTALAMIEAGMDVVHCIDSWKGTEDPTDRTNHLVRGHEPDHVYNVFKNNCGDLLHSRIFPHKGYSMDLVKEWDKPIDLLFIDADHSHEACKLDILEWGKFVASPGIICGHDFDSWDGVNKAVMETGGYERMGHSIWLRRK